MIFSFIVVATKVNIILPDEVQSRTLTDKLRRIDFLGSLTLVTAVGSFLLAFNLKTSEEMPWSDPLICGLLVSSVISIILFALVEKYWAPYPVMPVRLIVQRTPLAVSIANLFGSISAFSMASVDSVPCAPYSNHFCHRYTTCPSYVCILILAAPSLY